MTSDATSNLGTQAPDPEGLENPTLSRRRALIDAARKLWIRDLIDISSRNNLLNYRDLRAGTLSFDEVDADKRYSLLAGKSLKLSQLFKVEASRTDAVRRAKVLFAKSKAAKEERGIQTLHLACGLASWKSETGSAPSAPFLLVPLELTPAGGAQSEFSVSVNGELDVNPVLLHRLRSDFSLELDPAELSDVSGIVDAIDTPEEFDAAIEWMRRKCQSVPEFDLDQRMVVGNFSYAKLPMVKDLEESLDALLENELIAALAGDEDAQRGMRTAGGDVRVPSPDDMPSSDEFLVLDADSSQSAAINAVVAGRNLIVRGPPGTGKSQTISNMVATLVARGKKVLFVAEKRAAIDAVVGRLDNVGLADLVMDLHATGQSKKATVESIASAIAMNAAVTPSATAELHSRLDENKARLVAHVDALHSPREPWGTCVFDAECELLRLGEAGQTDTRLKLDDLNRLSASELSAAETELRDIVGLAGLGLAASGTPWASSPVASDEEVQAVRSAIESALNYSRTLRTRFREAQLRSGFRDRASRQPWGEDLELWQRLTALLDVWQPGAFDLPVGDLVLDVEDLSGSPPSRMWASISDGSYRAGKKSLRSALKAGVELAPSELYAQSQLLQAAKQDLIASTGAFAATPPEDLELLIRDREIFEQVLAEVANLSAAPIPDDLDGVDALLDRLRLDTTTLARLPRIARLKANLKQRGLEELLTELANRHHTVDDAIAALRRAFLTSLLDHVRFSDERISSFDGVAHSRTSETFVADDHAHISTAAQRVKRACAEMAIAAQNENVESAKIVQAEAKKKRPRKNLRQLFSEAPDVMLAIKPCWAMSPLVVSQVLPADQQYFDVVIFDEGSQIRPADAILPIMRGKQVVVAGDERQLPPTDFFSVFAGDDGIADDDAPALSVTSEFESILDALSAFVEVRTLGWHYRSRDERLIAFSNAFIYDRSLVTFPGVLTDGAVKHVLIDRTADDPNAGESSNAEVRRVVELVLEHARNKPDESLGVITMGIKHADRVDAAIRIALAEAEEMTFFREDRPEPFFVKNLERVQGDERDAIILSIGYGKGQDGRMVYRFGPLNMEGGERRLNVAVTRAKSSMTLVSSFSNVDMDPEKCRSRGVELLRAYVEFCSGGGVVGSTLAPPPELNPFEIDIRNELARAGIPLIAQFGCSGYRIDFAASHRDRPGEMVLAIECDGASYHSSQSARDRDRLRQEHLERLGWRFHRIWSQDWFRDRVTETEKAKLAYEKAVIASERSGETQAATSGPSGGERASAVSESFSTPSRPPKPRFSGTRNTIDAYGDGELVMLADWVASDGLLRTDDAWASEIRDALGFRRNGAKISRRIDDAIAAARAQSSAGSD